MPEKRYFDGKSARVGAKFNKLLGALLRDATALRMEADVRLGSFLSGGTGSSLVTAAFLF